jgi:hypothetical protein
MAGVSVIGLLDHIGDVKGSWSLAAFAIAAILSAYNIAANKPATRSTLWIIVGAICVLAMVPVVTDAFVHHPVELYRLRVTALDPAGDPLVGATIKTTATNSRSTGEDGIGELAIPRAALQQDGKITIFADKPTAFLQGSKDITLADDPNPTITIRLQRLPGATVTGIVEDQEGHALAGVHVTVPGGNATTTDNDGNFTLQTTTAPGEELELHAEKPGYTALTQRHVAGGAPATIVISRQQSLHPKRKPTK